MPQIIPIKDLKDTASVSELCHTLNEPIYITKNGYGDMVLMSMDYYEATQTIMKPHRKNGQCMQTWRSRKNRLNREKPRMQRRRFSL